MLHEGAYLRINMPDMFADPEFMAYLNDTEENSVATWHKRGSDDEAHAYSDTFVQFDCGEGSNANMPEKWWNLICEICESQGFEAGILHLTNLDV
jgi:hypothetical protein